MGRRKTTVMNRRRAALAMLTAPAVLAGCLRPMLAEDQRGAKIRSKVQLPDFDDRFGYFLDRSLRARLGAPDSPAYRLSVSTQIADRGLAVGQDNSVTRITLTAVSAWQLWPLGTGATEPILSDSIRVQYGYSATTSLFATRQARLDIERRLAREIGEQIARTIQARADEVLANG